MSDKLKRHARAQRWVFLVFFVLILTSMIGAQISPVAQTIARGERVSLLIFGVDAADYSQHTDTMMVGVLDPVNNFMNVLSIPRDTRITWPGYRFRRVNEIYGYQLRTTKNRTQAAEKVLEGLSFLLSSEDQPVVIPYYLQVDFSGFRKMVDLLGGVWVTIKIPMHYDDNAGDYHFHMEPGRYLLDGDEALRYVRFRGATGDRGRIYRQQEFLRDMIRRLANPMVVLRIPEMITAAFTSIESNLSFWDMVYLAVSSRRLRSGDVGFYILPGQTSGAYWSPKKEMARPLASMLIRGAAASPDLKESIADMTRVTVNVWNASGRKGAAYSTTRFLREKGYDVIDWGTYAAEQLQSRVIDRRGRISNAQAVAETLGIDNYHSEPNAKVLVDVEVVVGRNYAGVRTQEE